MTPWLTKLWKIATLKYQTRRMCHCNWNGNVRMVQWNSYSARAPVVVTNKTSLTLSALSTATCCPRNRTRANRPCNNKHCVTISAPENCSRGVKGLLATWISWTVQITLILSTTDVVYTTDCRHVTLQSLKYSIKLVQYITLQSSTVHSISSIISWTSPP